MRPSDAHSAALTLQTSIASKPRSNAATAKPHDATPLRPHLRGRSEGRAVTEFGYALSSEEHPPTALVDFAVRAEAAGFDFVSISDHFHPWVSAQGRSPFVWSCSPRSPRSTH